MTEYKSNSHSSKKMEASNTEREKKIEKVVTGSVKTRDNKGRKFADIFISEDASNVKSYIIMDVLVPAIKKAVSDIVTDGISMILYGGTGGNRSKGSSGNKVSYTRYYDDRRDDRREDRYVSRNRFDYEDIVFDSRGEAEAVRKQMLDVIDRYGYVTVADMYDMAGITPPYTSNNYGWVSIRNAEAVRVRDGGYVLRLPKAVPID